MSLNQPPDPSWYDQEQDSDFGIVQHQQPSNRLGLKGWVIFALLAAMTAILVWGVTRSDGAPESYDRFADPVAVKVEGATLNEANYRWFTYAELERLTSPDLLDMAPRSTWEWAIGLFNDEPQKDALCSGFIDITENRTNTDAYMRFARSQGFDLDQTMTSSIVFNWACAA